MYPLTIASNGTTCAFLTSIDRPANRSLNGWTSAGISSTFAVNRWFGMISRSRSNQKSEISVSSLPLPGMPCAVCDVQSSKCLSVRGDG